MHLRRKLRKNGQPEVVLTPLIDVALTLVVILLLVAPMVQHSIKVELPQGNSKEVNAQQELVVTMNKEGKIFFNSYPVRKVDLAEQVLKAMDGHSEMPIYIRADTEK